MLILEFMSLSSSYEILHPKYVNSSIC